MENKTYTEEDILDFLKNLYCFVPVIDLQIKIDNWKEGRKRNIEKKALFVTEDGVDIFKGDAYAYVPKKTLEWINTSDGRSYPQPEDSFLYFSTKEKAQEHVFKNKPCLSYTDFIAICTASLSTKDAIFVDTKALENLIKSKLKKNITT